MSSSMRPSLRTSLSCTPSAGLRTHPPITAVIIVVREVFMAEELNRRNFIKAAALAAGPAIISARGANDKINVGWIGVGTRGRYGLEWLHTAAPNDTQITAVCDTYKGYINRAVDT